MSKRVFVTVGLVVAAGTAIGLSTVAFANAAAITTSTITSSSHQMRLRYDARLNQAVRDGTITAAQRTAFQTEAKTLRTERKAAISKSSTKAERQTERAKLKSELQAWASSHNFPLAKIFPRLAS